MKRIEKRELEAGGLSCLNSRQFLRTTNLDARASAAEVRGVAFGARLTWTTRE